MALAFIKGRLSRDPYYSNKGKAAFWASTVEETYMKNGEEKSGGFHDVVAFGEEAERLATASQGDTIDVRVTIRYKPDERFVFRDKDGEIDEKKNPFMANFVVQSITEIALSEEDDYEEEDDPFGDV